MECFVRKLTSILLIILLFSVLSYQQVFGFDGDSHTQITTEALSFLKEDVLERIIGGNAGLFDALNQHNPEVHFDSCNFIEGYRYINTIYDEVVGMILKDDIRAPKYFGHLLHTAQDLYAHSNLVETGVSYIIDDLYGLWNNGKAIEPYTLIGGRMFVEGEPPEGLTLSVDKLTKTATITGNNETYIGIISGMAYISGGCPSVDVIGHWDKNYGLFPVESDQASFDGSGLNKDTKLRPRFQEAYNLAVSQTKHEWCRLLYLTSKEISQADAIKLLESWVSPENQQLALTDCESGTMQGVLAKDSITSDFDYCSDTFQRLAYPVILPEVQKKLSELNSLIDNIDEANGVYYYDAYANVVKMPPNITPESLLSDIVLNLDWYMNASLYNPSGKNWYYHVHPQFDSNLPSIGSLLIENINFTGSSFGLTMSGSRLITDITPNRIVLTSITRKDIGHPTPGSREIGFQISKNGYISFYTRSVARTGTSLVMKQPGYKVDSAQSDMFSSQEAWSNLIGGIDKKVTENGGIVIDTIARMINTNPTKPDCN